MKNGGLHGSGRVVNVTIQLCCVKAATLKDLDSINCQVSVPSPFRMVVGRCSIIAVVYMMRCQELMELQGWCMCTGRCQCDAHIRVRNNTMTLKLEGEKMNQDGTMMPRSVQCCCRGQQRNERVPLCPVCATRAM